MHLLEKDISNVNQTTVKSVKTEPLFEFEIGTIKTSIQGSEHVYIDLKAI